MAQVWDLHFPRQGIVSGLLGRPFPTVTLEPLIRDATVCIIVYDVTQATSFARVAMYHLFHVFSCTDIFRWWERFNALRGARPRCPLVVIGNKADIPKRAVCAGSICAFEQIPHHCVRWRQKQQRNGATRTVIAVRCCILRRVHAMDAALTPSSPVLLICSPHHCTQQPHTAPPPPQQ